MKGLFLDHRRKPNDIAWIQDLQKDKDYSNIEWTIFSDVEKFNDFVEDAVLDFEVISLDFSSNPERALIHSAIHLNQLRFVLEQQDFIPKYLCCHTDDAVTRDAVQSGMEIILDNIMESKIVEEEKEFNGLFLDDERQPKDVTWLGYPDKVNWTVVKDIYQFRKKLQENTYTLVSFDYYLGVGYPNGKDALELMIEMCEEMNYPVPKIVKFHSSATDMAAEMSRLWKWWLKDKKSALK